MYASLSAGSLWGRSSTGKPFALRFSFRCARMMLSQPHRYGALEELNFRQGAFLATALILFAALLRFPMPQYGIFLRDQVVQWSDARTIVTDGRLPLVGPTAGIGYLGPAYYYLLAVPASISADPIAGGYFVALLSVLSVYLCYVLARDLFGTRTSAIAAVLYAAAPYSVRYSSFIWNPNLLPFFTAIMLISTVRVIRGDSRYAVLVFGSLAIMLQLHLTSLAAIPFLLTIALIHRPRIRKAHIFAGAILFVALYSPFLYHEVQENFVDLRSALSEGRVIGPSLSGEAKVFAAAAELTAGPFGSNLTSITAVILLGIFVISIPNLIWKSLRSSKESRSGARVCLLWISYVLVMLMFLYVGTVRFFNLGVPVHYVLLLYPVPYIGIGLLLSDIYQAFRGVGPTWSGLMTVGLLFLVVSGQALTSAIYIQEHGTSSLTLKGMRGILAVIESNTAGPFEVSVIPSDSEQVIGLNYLATLDGRFGSGAEYVVVDTSLGSTSTLAAVTRSLPLVGSVGDSLKIYRVR